jgi:hypothetical protein
MKILEFLEEHIEKIVIALAVIICLWLLVTGVVMSPNTVEYDGREFGPDQIDKYISKKAEQLRIQINKSPESKQAYQSRLNEFTNIFQTPLHNIYTQKAFPQPIYLETNEGITPKYAVPEIGDINDVQAEHLRTVAYVPSEEITLEQGYTEDISGPNDIDIVTVAGEFNLAGLYERFKKSFAGENLRETWRDKSISKPVAAGVQLQRQRKTETGQWTEWKDVKRTKINPLPEDFGIVEDINELPAGGIKVRMLRFENTGVLRELLQPEAYRVASADDQWFPPKLHAEYLKYQQQLEEQQKRREMLEKQQQKQAQRDKAMETRRQRREELESRSTTRGGGGGGGMPGGMGGMGGGMAPPGGMGGSDTQQSDISEKLRQRQSQQQTGVNLENIVTVDIDELYEDFKELMIDDEFDIEELTKPVTFWAFDDTVESDTEYRYRIRIGFFNPIAGTEKFAEGYRQYQDDVILWSDYSQTDTIKVPKELYFFARQGQPSRNSATVQIFKYVMGYWHSQNFTVEAGEIIGGKAKPQKNTSPGQEQDKEDEKLEYVIPDEINFSTGAVMIDVFGPITEWAGGRTLRQKYYYDMLYTYDGDNFENMPIRTSYWNEMLRAKFYELKRYAKQEKKPLKSWSESSRFDRRARTSPMMREGDGMMGPGMMGPGMEGGFMMPMPQGQRRR